MNGKTFTAIDFDRYGVRVKRNLPSVWVVNLLWGRIVFRSYPAHKYLIVKPLHRTVFDWWPKDRGDRLRVLNRIVLK